MVEAHHSEDEFKDESFVEVPAILEKYKAAAAIADGKLPPHRFALFLDPIGALIGPFFVSG